MLLARIENRFPVFFVAILTCCKSNLCHSSAGILDALDEVRLAENEIRAVGLLDLHGREFHSASFFHFNNTNNITTGVLALIECFKFAGMWTHVPTWAS